MEGFESKYKFYDKRVPIADDNPAVHFDETKCKNCTLCRRACETTQTVLDYYSLERTGDVPVCVHCGQCANACPFGAMMEVDDTNLVKAAIADPDKVVVFQTAPAVRVAIAEEFGAEAGTFAQGKMISALRALGGDYVFDTNFGADMTIMEEASELVRRITTGNFAMPQFTSCCPAWVEFAETFYAEYIPHLSSAKSPILMQNTTEKIWFAEKAAIDPQKMVTVCVTPCTAKKAEIKRKELNAAAEYWHIDGLKDSDICITTRELARWLKAENIDFNTLDDGIFDSHLGEASGGGIIFGSTGGVMESALRSAYYFYTGKPMPAEYIPYEPVRGLDGVKEATIDFAGISLHVAVVSGLGNARRFLDKIMADGTFKDYTFIEFMACQGGCINGGGQPKVKMPLVQKTNQARMNSLYKRDSEVSIKAAWENPEIQELYSDFYEQPLSERSEKYIHTFFEDKSGNLGEGGAVTPQTNPLSPKYKPIE